MVDEEFERMIAEDKKAQKQHKVIISKLRDLKVLKESSIADLWIDANVCYDDGMIAVAFQLRSTTNENDPKEYDLTWVIDDALLILDNQSPVDWSRGVVAGTEAMERIWDTLNDYMAVQKINTIGQVEYVIGQLKKRWGEGLELLEETEAQELLTLLVWGYKGWLIINGIVPTFPMERLTPAVLNQTWRKPTDLEEKMMDMSFEQRNEIIVFISTHFSIEV